MNWHQLTQQMPWHESRLRAALMVEAWTAVMLWPDISLAETACMNLYDLSGIASLLDCRCVPVSPIALERLAGLSEALRKGMAPTYAGVSHDG